jgi:BirA family biotin operon repressor/biotin-[acetyl-CoA-carboxylase] ligase
VAESGFSVPLFRRLLGSEHFGQHVRAVPEARSTIDLAWEWLRAGGPEGGVVIAERQTGGRGRLGRAWASPKGGLWMSLLARPEIPAGGAPRLSLGLAAAGAEAVATEARCPVGVKWPNDVMVGGRKAGGVLVETEVAGERVAAAVLSLGLNVNLSAGDLPEEVRDTATSLLAQTGREHRIESLAARVLENLERLWPTLIGGEGFSDRWRQWDVLAGKEVTVEAGGKVLRGRAEGIDGEGALLLAVEGGRRRLLSGEVRGVRMVER